MVNFLLLFTSSYSFCESGFMNWFSRCNITFGAGYSPNFVVEYEDFSNIHAWEDAWGNCYTCSYDSSVIDSSAAPFFLAIKIPFFFLTDYIFAMVFDCSINMKNMSIGSGMLGLYFAYDIFNWLQVIGTIGLGDVVFSGNTGKLKAAYAGDPGYCYYDPSAKNYKWIKPGTSISASGVTLGFAAKLGLKLKPFPSRKIHFLLEGSAIFANGEINEIEISFGNKKMGKDSDIYIKVSDVYTISFGGGWGL